MEKIQTQVRLLSFLAFFSKFPVCGCGLDLRFAHCICIREIELHKRKVRVYGLWKKLINRIYLPDSNLKKKKIFLF